MTVFIDNERVRCDRRTFESDFVKDFIKVGQQVFKEVKVEYTLFSSLVSTSMVHWSKNRFETHSTLRKWRRHLLIKTETSASWTSSSSAVVQTVIKPSGTTSTSSWSVNPILAVWLNLSAAKTSAKRSKMSSGARSQKFAETFGWSSTKRWAAPIGKSTAPCHHHPSPSWSLVAHSVTPRLTTTVKRESPPLSVSPQPPDKVLFWHNNFLHTISVYFFINEKYHFTLGGTGYINHVAYQDPRLNIVCYNVMLQAIKNMMGKFQDANGGALPEKLIWYRGGASTGSYQQILKNEMKGNFRIFFYWDSACFSHSWHMQPEGIQWCSLQSGHHLRRLRAKQPLEAFRQKCKWPSRRRPKRTSWHCCHWLRRLSGQERFIS